MRRIAIITNVLPVYRKAFYKRILSLDNCEITIYCQETLKGFNLNLCHKDLSENVKLVAVSSLDREKFAWQYLPIKNILQRHDLFIFYGNPRVFSNVIWSLFFRLLGKKVAVWGQAHTANAQQLSENIRLCWWKCFKNIFVYSDDEVTYLRNKKFKVKNIVGMNNGLDQKSIEHIKSSWTEKGLEQWLVEKKLIGKKIVLSCARLEAKNQFHLALEALSVLVKSEPNLVWCAIGDGAEKEKLFLLAKTLNIEEHIYWVGALYDENDLAPWFMNAKVMLHPAAIGLSLLHAFGYALPVITHDNEEKHMPEFLAMKHNVTGFLYREGDINSLVNELIRVLNDDTILNRTGIQALETVQISYNVDVMAKRFEAFVEAMQ